MEIIPWTLKCQEEGLVNSRILKTKISHYLPNTWSNSVISHQEINDKYNVRCNFLNILQLRQSIPFACREAIHGTDVKNIHININNITLTDQNGNVLDIRHVNCKTIYWIFLYKKLRQTSCIDKWTIDYPEFQNVEQPLWKNNFCCTFHITGETKLQRFQYRILHRTITCRKNYGMWN